MNIEMVPIEIIGIKADLHRFLAVSRSLGCIHIDSVNESQEILVRGLTLEAGDLQGQEALSLLAARIEGLLEILGRYQAAPLAHTGPDVAPTIDEIARQVDQLLPAVQAATRSRAELESEQASLPLYEATLRKLLPLMPEAAYAPGSAVVGTLVNRANVSVLDLVCMQVLEITQGSALVVSRDVDEFTRAMLIVLDKRYLPEVESLLGQKDVSRLRLPPELGGGLPNEMLEMIRRRMNEIPVELKRIDQDLASLAVHQAGRLADWKAIVSDESQGYQVLSLLGETDMTFVLAGWVPVKDLQRVKASLHQAFGETIYLQELALTPEMKHRAPIILQNPLPARPFESLVRLLALPEYGRVDPTRLMSLFLPIFFGLMLGDIGYGLILLAAGIFLARKFKPGVARDLMIVIAMGSGWAIFFGILFGEVFGTLGESLGLHPIWMARDGAEDVQSLLLMTVAIGAGHVSLGLVLGVWDALRARSRTHLLERGGMLLGLVSLFFIVGVLTKYLPDGFMTPAVAGLILGIVFLSVSLGWLGILMGPIEFIGLIGNVLSYLRIAAIGLASVYLAKVANSLAGMTGSIAVGLILAVLIHALNLVLGAFSPTIHSLRLHYVEFFRKFYEGGGRPYEPYRSRLS